MDRREQEDGADQQRLFYALPPRATQYDRK